MNDGYRRGDLLVLIDSSYIWSDGRPGDYTDGDTIVVLLDSKRLDAEDGGIFKCRILVGSKVCYVLDYALKRIED